MRTCLNPGQAKKEVKTKGFIEFPSMEDGQPARAPVDGRCRWMRKASAKRWTMVDGRRGQSASMVLGHDGVSEVKEVTAGINIDMNLSPAPLVLTHGYVSCA